MVRGEDERAIAEAMAVLWRRQGSPRPGPKPRLTLSEIARVGVELADRGGLPAASLQEIASVLGITKMALYRYVPSKMALVALMTDEAMRFPDDLRLEPGDWRGSLSRWAYALSDLLLRHGWVLEATQGARPVGPIEMLWLEKAVACLAVSKLSGPARIDTVAVISGLVRAFAAQQVAAPPGQDAGAVLVGMIQDGAQGGAFPALAAALAEPANTGNHGLDHGLQLIFDGLERTMSER